MRTRAGPAAAVDGAVDVVVDPLAAVVVVPPEAAVVEVEPLEPLADDGVVVVVVVVEDAVTACRLYAGAFDDAFAPTVL